MLEIVRAVDEAVPCIVEVDPYIPVAFKTYSNVLPGPRYFRIGNFSTSLLEIGVERSSLVIRKVTLVQFDTVLPHGKLRPNDGLPVTIGLPVVSQESAPEDRIDEHSSFGVSLGVDSFGIDWCNGKELSACVRFGRVLFCLAGRELRRIVFSDLTSSEVGLLEAHIKRTMPQGF